MYTLSNLNSVIFFLLNVSYIILRPKQEIKETDFRDLNS